MHTSPWSPEERQDSVQMLDWISTQPWCKRNAVGMWGVSYEGTAAFNTSILQHPAVRAVCPMYFFWDAYDDLAYPGGVPMQHFTHEWQVSSNVITVV
jgi:uncharacterized protein